jgi:hypothetical protein
MHTTGSRLLARHNVAATVTNAAIRRYASQARILKDTYKDSIELMRLSNQLKSGKGVKDAAVMIATEANVELMKNAGLVSASDLATVSLNADLIISVSSDDEGVVQATIKQAIELLTTSAGGSGFGDAGGPTKMVCITIFRKELP